MGRVLQASHRLRALRAAIAVGLVPSVAFAAPGPKATVRVEIDVSAVDKFDAGGIEKDVRARTEVIVDEQGYFLDDGADDKVVVKIDYVDKKDLEYGIHIVVYDDGKEVRPGEEWVVCKYCSHALVGERVAARLPGALARLRKANEKAGATVGEGAPAAPEERSGTESEAEAESPAAPEHGEEEVVPTASVEDRRRASLGTMGKVGVGLLAGGAAGLVAGGIVFAQKQKVDNPAGRLLEAEARDFRPPGTAVLITGGVLATTGLVLLVIDHLRTRKKGRAAAKTTRIVPSGAGAMFFTKF